MTLVSKTLRDATTAVWELENRAQFLEEQLLQKDAMIAQLQAALATKNSIKPDIRITPPLELMEGKN